MFDAPCCCGYLYCIAALMLEKSLGITYPNGFFFSGTVSSLAEYAAF